MNQKNQKELYQNKEWLYDQYWNKELSTVQIAEKCNVSDHTISRWLRKYNISIRSNSERSKLIIKQNRGNCFKKGNKIGHRFGKGNRFGNQFKNGSENAIWKGNEVTYKPLHQYLKKYKPKSNKCERCGKTNCRIELSFDHSKGKHTRNINDYKWLCSSCHHKRDWHEFDLMNNQYTIKKRGKKTEKIKPIIG